MAKKSREDDEVSIDFKKVKNFFSNKNLFNNQTLLVLLLVIAVFFSIYFRAYPSYLPITEDWARNSAYNSIRNNIATQINQQYPNLPSANKNQLINEQVEQVFEQQGSQIEQQIQATSEYFKQRLKNDNGQTYLLAIDPYQHLRRAENILENGHVGDTLRDGKPYLTRRFAPIGDPVHADMHPLFIYYFYRFLNIFGSGITMLMASFWAPVLLSALAVIPGFFIAKRRAGLFGGFIAGLIIAIHPVFIGRTAAGFSDTDPYAVLFPLLIAWFFIEGFEAKSLIKKIVLTILSAFFVGVFAFSWSGWWYSFDLLIGLSLVYIGYRLLRLVINKTRFKKIVSDESLRNTVIILIIFLVCSALFVPLLTGGRNNIKSAVTGPILRTQLKVAAHSDYWPNIQTTVAELNPISIPGAINQMGGKLLFFIAALGLILSLVKVNELKKKDYAYLAVSALFLLIMLSKSLLNLSTFTYLVLLALPVIAGFILLLKEDRKIDIKYAILLILWFIGSLYAVTKGTRFTLLLVPAFAIAFGISLGLIHKMLTILISKEFKIKKVITSLVLIVLLCMLLISPIRAAHNASLREVPSMNDAWWQTLEDIKLNSSQDAIINSWWDFGHWFKYVADRPVTVDGGGQDYQLAHWMGTVLVSSDEDRSVDILRMLDCGSRLTYRTLLNETDDVLLSVNLTKTIIRQTEAEARQTLEQAGITSQTINKTLGYAFCEPPENYLITSEDMVGKAGVWGHFGSWDFRRAYAYINSRNKKAQTAIPNLTQGLGISEEEATEYYYDVQALTSEAEGNTWIAPWPNYFTKKWASCTYTQKDQDENSTNTTDDTGLEQAGLMVCRVNQQINNNQQGRIVLENIVLDLDNYDNSTMTIGAYDASSGYRTGGGKAIPSSFVLFKEEGIERIEMDNTTFPYDVLIDLEQDKALITDPLLSESLFTKLFYLDGRYTEHFEKFSDKTTVNGERVIVWKVKWPE